MRLAGLEIPAKAEFVSLARLVVSSIAGDRYDLSDDQLDNLKLAVSEACVMMIDANKADGDGHVTVDCIGANGRLEVLVGCRGSHFGPFGEPMSADEERQSIEQQLGLPLIASLVDEVVVERGDSETSQLRMTMHCERAEEL